MKTLILIRHSKSSWDLPRKDIDRPLSKRGINDAHLLSNSIKDVLPPSYIVWSSVAKRTKDTALIFSQNLQIPFDTVMFKEALYTFDENTLEKQIKGCSNKHHNLILFGHNDAITNFVNKFGSVLIENVPTSGVVKIDFDSDTWEQIQKGKTTATVFPSHLKNEKQSQSIHR